MKTRNGFVSNSSSTSFLIAVKKSKNKSFSDPATVIDFLVNHSFIFKIPSNLKSVMELSSQQVIDKVMSFFQDLL